jgi:hypothetical protein
MTAYQACHWICPQQNCDILAADGWKAVSFQVAKAIFFADSERQLPQNAPPDFKQGDALVRIAEATKVPVRDFFRDF